MKKFLFSIICTLLPILASAQVQNEELTPYAVLSDDHTVLTFFYDNDKESQGGMDVGPFTSADERGWNEYCESIEQVVFVEAFAGCEAITSTRYWFQNFTNLTTIIGLGNLKTNHVTDMAYMFAGCSSLTSLDLGGFDTSNAIYLSGMFMDCSGLTNLDLENFNTSKATDMDYMFYGCSSLTSLEVSGFNTAEAKYMDSMFAGCSSLISLDLSNFNTSNVNTMDGMFAGCSSLTNLDVSGFVKITGLSHMFQDCSSLTSLDLSNFDTSNTYSMEYTFAGCSGLTSLDLSNFNTEKVTTMYGMFYGCSGLTSLDLSEFDTSNTTKLNQMFWGCSGLTSLNVTGFDTSKATDMSHMFTGCSKLTSLELSNFDTSNVTTMGAMFHGCSSLTSLTLGENFNTSNVTTMGSMFYGCSSLTSLDLSNFNTSNVTGMGMMFDGCSSLTSLIFGENFDTSNVTSMNQMFWGCSGLTSLNVTGFDTSKATDMSYMFAGCSSLTSLDLSNFNTSNVTNMGTMFYSCSSLTSLDLSNFNTSNVTKMREMFSYCTSLTSLDLSSFDTSSVSEMVLMFGGDSSLTTINAGEGWSTDNISSEEDGAYMFSGCEALVGGEGTTYDDNHLDYTYAHIDKATDPGYLAEKLDYNEGDFFTTETVEGVTMSFRVDDATQRICRVMAPEEDQRAIDTATTGTVTIPAKAHGYTVNRINDYAFQDCSGVTEFVIPNSVESIEQCAFKRCTSLTTVHIPASVNSIDGLNGKPWVGCTSLTTITVDEENPNFDSRDNCNAIMETADDILYMGCKGTKIPETTKVIGHSSFDSMGELPALEIPASVTSIVAYAFWECSFPSVTSYIEEPFSTSSVWDHLPANCPLYVPEGKVEAYKAVYEWSNFTTIIEIGTEAYAALNEDNTKLTFYYDNKKEERGGMSVGPFTETSQRGWDQKSGKIEQVEFDDSFASCTTITSTSLWFAHLEKLETIKNLDHLKTDNVTDMKEMFYRCTVLTDINVTGFNTSKVTDMRSMFWTCRSLTDIDVTGFNTSKVTDMYCMFGDCESLTSLDLSSFNTESVTDMSGMFMGCTNLTSLDISNFNTSNTNTLHGMFYGCNSLTSIDVSGFDTSKATSMGGLFGDCFSLTDIDVSGFDTSETTNMNGMFRGCSGLTSIDVSGFDTSKATEMTGMFAGCSSLTSLDLSGFKTANVSNMSEMFDGDALLATIYVGEEWNTENITSEESGANMFRECTALVGGVGTTYDANHVDYTYAHIDGGATNPGYLTDPNQPLPYAALNEDNTKLTFYYDNKKEERGGMSVGPFTAYEERGWNEQSEIIEQVVFDDSFAEYKPTSTRYWFYNFRILTGIPTLEKLKTDNVTDMSNMFMYCEGLTSLDVSKFETSNVTNMWSMFNGCSKLTNLDVSKFQTTKATSLGYMFSGCSELTSLDVSGFDTSNTTYMNGMFHNCSSLESLDVSHFETSKVTSMLGIFHNCSSLTSLDVTNFNTSNVTNMNSMFGGCSKLTNIDVSGFDTSNATDMRGMFYDCSSLTSLDVTNFNTSKVTTTNAMFGVCSKLTNLDLSNFNTSNVTDMQLMFSQCSELETIFVGDEWSTESVTSEENGANMFTECTALVGGAGTNYDANHVDYTYAHIDGGTSSPGYLSGASQAVPYAALSDNNAVLTFYYDDQKVERNGMSVGPFEQWGGQGTKSGWSDVNEQITTVVFDDSFANCTTLTSTAYWFYGCENLTTIKNISNLNTDNVTDINSMFGDCHSLKSIDFSSLNLSNVTNMHQVFEDCRALESIDFSGVNTENVTNMGDLFLNCKSLKTIDISSFNTKNVTDMTCMFYKCDVLTTIYVGDGWTTKKVTESAQMFEKSPNLVGGRGTTYNASHIDAEYAHIDGGTSNPGYLTDINGASEETWAKLQSRIEYGTDVLSRAKEISSVDQTLIEKLDEALQNANQMYNIHTASEDEVLHMIEVLNERIQEVEEAMNQPASEETWAKLQSTIEYGTDVLSKAKEISTIDQWLIEELEMMLDSGNQMYKIHEASEEEVLNMIDELNWRIREVEEAMNQPASEETWEELKATIEYGTDVLAKAKEISTIDQWLIEELDMTLDSGNQMYKIHEASEEEVLNMIEELNWRIKEVEEAMNQPASDEAWAELNKAVETGEKLQTEAKGVSTVEPWALEELENMTAKGREMYKVHTAGEEEVRHMTEELNQIINEVEEMMRKQPQGEASFDGLTAYVSGNATLDDAFKSVGGRSEAAKTIAAIVWNADNALTANMLSGIDNPNLLIYVTEASKAPSGVQNVVIDGVASEIVLTDATGNNNFYCPQSFTAKSISYSRDFSQTTEIDVCRGWETIALPFDVQSITHESHGALVPFGGGSNGYPFWLRQLSTNGLARATKIEANHPYLLCMPNNIIYPPEYNQNGTVTFSSSNVTVPVTSARSSTSAGVTLHATFQQVTKNSSVYALNVGEARGEYPEGSVFEQDYRDIRPFQAYTTHSAGTRRFISLESIGGGNDDATGIEELRIKNLEFGDAEGVWYSLDGRRLDVKPTKKGVYVKDGRKIVIK